MKAISLWQPWATLIALGQKRIETRSWHPNYSGPLAIHAAMRKPRELEMGLRVEQALAGAGLTLAELPLGAVVCTVNLDATFEVEEETIWPDGYLSDYRIPPAEPELSFGNYAVGRFAWLLSTVRRLERPYHCRGAQKWFSVPDAFIESRLEKVTA